MKVDRSFVSQIGKGSSGSEMVRAIVGLAHTLGMDVVAEGVETAEQGAAARLIESQPWQAVSGRQQLVQ